jgi:hypothetical protein
MSDIEDLTAGQESYVRELAARNGLQPVTSSSGDCPPNGRTHTGASAPDQREQPTSFGTDADVLMLPLPGFSASARAPGRAGGQQHPA